MSMPLTAATFPPVRGIWSSRRGNASPAGMPAAQIAEEVQALASHVQASFVIDTLEFLYKGGRCSALAMLGANMLQLKPCIEVDNTSGSMNVGKKYRGSLDKALTQYVQVSWKAAPISAMTVSLSPIRGYPMSGFSW